MVVENMQLNEMEVILLEIICSVQQCREQAVWAQCLHHKTCLLVCWGHALNWEGEYPGGEHLGTGGGTNPLGYLAG